MNRPHAIIHLLQEGADHEIQSAVPKLLKRHHRCRVSHDRGMVGQNLLQHLANAVGVGTIGHPNVQHHSIQFIRECPVRDPPRDQFLVGNDDLLAIPIPNRRGSTANAHDHARRFPHGDDVADTNGPLEQQDDSTDEVGDDFLKTVKTGDPISIKEDGTVVVG